MFQSAYIYVVAPSYVDIGIACNKKIVTLRLAFLFISWNNFFMGKNKGFGKKHPSFEEKKKILKAYKKGTSVTELSEMFGYHRVTLHRWIRESKFGKPCKRKSKPGSGRFQKIEEKEVNKLIELIKKPATKFGFETPFVDDPKNSNFV